MYRLRVLFAALVVGIACMLAPGSSLAATGDVWTPRASASNDTWIEVNYGGGLFVALSGRGKSMMTSPDGITWTSRASAADDAWTDVTYGNGVFVAISMNYTGTPVMTSPDGITWTSRASAADNEWSDVTYANDVFVAVSMNGTNQVMTSGALIPKIPEGTNSLIIWVPAALVVAGLLAASVVLLRRRSP